MTNVRVATECVDEAYRLSFHRGGSKSLNTVSISLGKHGSERCCPPGCRATAESRSRKSQSIETHETAHLHERFLEQVGGSLSGLICAMILADLGHNVSVLEQTPRNLEHQAAGIATGPAMSTFLQRHDKSERPLSLPCEGILTVDTQDQTLSELHVVRRLCSWDALYYRLRWNFDGLQSPYNPDPPPPRAKGQAFYHAGQRVRDVEVDNDGTVTAHVEDVNTGQANKHFADLLIGADGPNSTVRQLSLGYVPERKYPGYILWRGVVREDQVSARARELFSSHFTFLKLKREYAVV